MVCCYSSNRNLLLTDGASAIWSPATHGGNFLVTQLSLAVPSLPHLPMPSRASQDHLPVLPLSPLLASEPASGGLQTLPVFN